MRLPSWTFLSNHGHVLVCLASNPDVLLRDVAASVGITERAVQQIVSDLVTAGVVSRTRRGRCNHYEVDIDMCFRHPLEADVRIGTFIELLPRPALPPNVEILPARTEAPTAQSGCGAIASGQ
jgi:hypothetical protein